MTESTSLYFPDSKFRSFETIISSVNHFEYNNHAAKPLIEVWHQERQEENDDNAPQFLLQCIGSQGERISREGKQKTLHCKLKQWIKIVTYKRTSTDFNWNFYTH